MSKPNLTRADDLVERGLDAASAYDRDLRELRRGLLGTRLALCLAVVALAVLMFVLVGHNQQIDQRATTAKARADTAATGNAKTAVVAKRADQNGKTAIRVLRGEQGIPGVRGANGKLGSPGLPGLRGRTGKRGPRGFTGPTGKFPGTLDDLAARIQAGCPGGTCEGPTGKDGVDGRDGAALTQDQVNDGVALKIAQAVTANCGGPCNGRDGQPGADGAPSTVPGPAGADGATGPAGATGATGATGPEPASVPATQVAPDGTVVNCTATDPTGTGNYTC